MTKIRDAVWLKTLLVALTLTLVGAACADTSDDTDPGGEGSEDLSGDVVVSGSSTVEPISVAVGEKYIAVNPDVAVKVDGPGTSDGFELFCEGDTDISDASRPIDPEEVEVCEKNGIEFIELKVAIDGLSVITSVNNTRSIASTSTICTRSWDPSPRDSRTGRMQTILRRRWAPATCPTPTYPWTSRHRVRNRGPSTLSRRS